MKRKNVLILLLVFLFLLTPSCVLFVRALATSPFPERDKVSEVEIRFESSGGVKADGAIPVLRDVDSREVDLLYAIFNSAERIPRWDLPEKSAAYRLAFRGERPEEVLTLYFGASDLSLYVLTSGKKLYRLAMPTATHRNTVLTPSAASFSLNGEEIVSLYDYPEYANGPTGIAEISLSAWDIVADFNFVGQNVTVNYALYSSPDAQPYETTDKNKIVPYDPDTVRMDVSADLSGGISVTLHYYLNVQE
ncbi:MAG: hypothetical protein J5958_06120 [Clostridia bacterium]|nr:hypothetical protein [Clostridia bacterium]